MPRALARLYICEHCGRRLSPGELMWVDPAPDLEPRLLFALCADKDGCADRPRREGDCPGNPAAVCYVPSRVLQ